MKFKDKINKIKMLRFFLNVKQLGSCLFAVPQESFIKHFKMPSCVTFSEKIHAFILKRKNGETDFSNVKARIGEIS